METFNENYRWVRADKEIIEKCHALINEAYMKV
jgi:hypothetical protein